MDTLFLVIVIVDTVFLVIVIVDTLFLVMVGQYPGLTRLNWQILNSALKCENGKIIFSL